MCTAYTTAAAVGPSTIGRSESPTKPASVPNPPLASPLTRRRRRRGAGPASPSGLPPLHHPHLHRTSALDVGEQQRGRLASAARGSRRRMGSSLSGTKPLFPNLQHRRAAVSASHMAGPGLPLTTRKLQRDLHAAEGSGAARAYIRTSQSGPQGL